MKTVAKSSIKKENNMTETHLQIKAMYEAYLVENEAFETKGV